MNATGKRWTRRPPGSNWGDFGDDDQIGRINLLTPETVKRASQEIREGVTFCLSLPLDRPGRSPNPSRFPPRRFATVRNGIPFFNYQMAQVDERYTDVACDDAVLLHMQFSTQWDALSHAGGLFDVDDDGHPEVVFYNGWRGGEDIEGVPEDVEVTPGCGFEGVTAHRLGIETLAEHGIQGRGVLVDLNRHFGREPRKIGFAELRQVIENDGVSVEEGDILCFYTGFADVVIEMGLDTDVNRLYETCCTLDGRDDALLQWITDSGVAAIVADNYAVEAFPARESKSARCAMLPLHELCLFKQGIPLGELWFLTDLANWLRRNNRYRFFLTAPPLRMPGSVGSPVTPIATV